MTSDMSAVYAVGRTRTPAQRFPLRFGTAYLLAGITGFAVTGVHVPICATFPGLGSAPRKQPRPATAASGEGWAKGPSRSEAPSSRPKQQAHSPMGSASASSFRSANGMRTGRDDAMGVSQSLAPRVAPTGEP